LRAVGLLEAATLVVVAFIGLVEVLHVAAKKLIDLRKACEKLFGRTQLRR
jgi:hypothetical protein